MIIISLADNSTSNNIVYVNEMSVLIIIRVHYNWNQFKYSFRHAMHKLR